MGAAHATARPGRTSCRSRAAARAGRWPAPRSPWRRRRRAGRPWPGPGPATRRRRRALAVRRAPGAAPAGLQRRAVAVRRGGAGRGRCAPASGASPLGRLDVPLVGRDAVDGAQDRRCGRPARTPRAVPRCRRTVRAGPGRRRRSGGRRRGCGRRRAAPPRRRWRRCRPVTTSGALPGRRRGWWSSPIVARAPSTSWASRLGPPVGPGGRAGGAGVGLGERHEQVEQLAAAADRRRWPRPGLGVVGSRRVARSMRVRCSRTRVCTTATSCGGQPIRVRIASAMRRTGRRVVVGAGDLADVVQQGGEQQQVGPVDVRGPGRSRGRRSR